MHGMYTHEKHKNNAIELLPRRHSSNYNNPSDDWQTHFVTLVARMRFQTRGTRKSLSNTSKYERPPETTRDDVRFDSHDISLSLSRYELFNSIHRFNRDTRAFVREIFPNSALT